jgi:hypothetical protein
VNSRRLDSHLFWRDQRVAVTDGGEFLGAFIVEKLTAQWEANGSTSSGSGDRWGCRAAFCDNKRHPPVRLARPGADQPGDRADIPVD